MNDYFIRQLSNLEYLDIIYDKEITDHGIENLINLKSLHIGSN